MDEADTAQKLSGITSKRTQLTMISTIPDVDAEMEQIEAEKQTQSNVNVVTDTGDDVK